MAAQVIVIGGGHNGLVAANYLAKSGAQVTLLERSPGFGGPVGRVEYFPGYSASITNSPGSLDGRIVEELELERFGLRFASPPVTLLHPVREGLLTGWRDRAKLDAQFDAFAPGEAGRFHALIARLDALGETSRLSYWETPPPLDEILGRMTPHARSEFEDVILRGSLMELLDESLVTDAAKSVMMMLALNGQLLSPHAPGSAIGLLMRPISRASSPQDILGNQNSPLRGSVGLPLGSMAAIVDALTMAARANGVHLRANSAVTEIQLDDDGIARGVRLDSGEVLSGADAIVATLEPSRLAQLLPEGAVAERDTPRPPSGSAFKIALALDGIPDVRDAPAGASPRELAAAQFRIGPDPTYIAAAVHDGIAERPSTNPIIWGLMPSISSPGLAPEGKHLMSLNAWHAPHSLGAEYWRVHGDQFMSTCIEAVETLFPNLTDRIEDTRWFSPHDLEDSLGLTSSNITHGDMTAELMLNGRPGYGFANALRSMNVVVGGAGAWPGGYVTGVPGRNAAVTVHNTISTPTKVRK